MLVFINSFMPSKKKKTLSVKDWDYFCNQAIGVANIFGFKKLTSADAESKNERAMRAYIEQGMDRLPQPIKLYSFEEFGKQKNKGRIRDDDQDLGYTVAV